MIEHIEREKSEMEKIIHESHRVIQDLRTKKSLQDLEFQKLKIVVSDQDAKINDLIDENNKNKKELQIIQKEYSEY